MRNFARIGEQNIVEDLIVVADEDCLDADGQHSEQVGRNFIIRVTGIDAEWVESADDGLRFRPASVGMEYVREHDVFVYPVTCDDAIFDEITMAYLCPEDWDAEFLEQILDDDTLA